MKYMIAGFGSIGRRHFRNLIALGEQDILLYRTNMSTLPDEEIMDYPVETNLQRALDHRPDAVIIANPTAFHLDVAIPAAQAGCHIFLEKPVSNSIVGLDELLNAQQYGGGQIFVGFQFRFHPGLCNIRSLLEEKVLGKLLSVRAHWGEYLPNWHPWEDYRQAYSARADLGGGVLLTLCHPFDYLRWLVGEVEALWAFSGRLGDLELSVEDTAEVGFRFRNGTLGSLHLDYNQRPAQHYLDIIGTQGTIHWNYRDGEARVFPADNHNPGWETQILPSENEKLSNDRNYMFLDEMQHFIDVIRGNTQSRCTFDDGIQALRLALAAHESAQENQLVYL
jgi:predicted dehydrogenase